MERQRTAARGYGGRWQLARERYLAAHPLCVMCLPRLELATVVDHIKPHKLGDAIESGDQAKIAAARALFWDRTNWASLCTLHHNSTKQRLEKSGVVVGCDGDGIPIDSNHHWNKR